MTGGVTGMGVPPLRFFRKKADKCPRGFCQLCCAAFILERMKKLIAQFMKFGVVGFIAFFIDYGLLAFCTEVLHINYLVSATIGFTVSVVFNYLASMRYVFTHKEDMSRRREFVIFVVLSIIGLIINNAIMWAGVELAHVHYLVVKIFATAVVMVWNFVTRKKFLDAGDENARN